MRKKGKPDIRERFGFAVKGRREELGLTQEDFAEKVGIPQSVGREFTDADPVPPAGASGDLSQLCPHSPPVAKPRHREAGWTTATQVRTAQFA